MAQINSPSYTNYIASPQRKPKAREWGGRARSFCESILCGAAASAAQNQIAVAAGDCVRMFRVPANHKVIRGELFWSALGTGVSIFCGDAFDCDRWLTAADGSLASQLQGGCSPMSGVCGRFNNISASFNGPQNTPETGPGYLFTCDMDVIVTFGYGGAPVGVLTLVMETVVGD